MSTPLFAAFGVLAPMTGLLRRFSRAKVPPVRESPLPFGRARDLPTLAVAEPTLCARVGPTARAKSRANPPLRVVRVMESGQASAQGGRMMISGRMADVCAELDRMAEREAALRIGV